VAILLYGTACRPGEAYSLRWEAVALNRVGGLIQITQGKTANARRILPMVPRVHTMLVARHHAQGSPSEGWVFSSLGRCGHIIRQNCSRQHAAALRRSSVKPFPVYTLRHTALTRLADAGVDAFTLARIAGHYSVRITERYCHPQREAIEMAFAKLSLSQKGVTDGGYRLLGEALETQ